MVRDQKVDMDWDGVPVLMQSTLVKVVAAVVEEVQK
jgi:hypothetical protein